jgi:hypothetical protein
MTAGELTDCDSMGLCAANEGLFQTVVRTTAPPDSAELDGCGQPTLLRPNCNRHNISIHRHNLGTCWTREWDHMGSRKITSSARVWRFCLAFSRLRRVGMQGFLPRGACITLGDGKAADATLDTGHVYTVELD